MSYRRWPDTPLQERIQNFLEERFPTEATAREALGGLLYDQLVERQDLQHKNLKEDPRYFMAYVNLTLPSLHAFADLLEKHGFSDNAERIRHDTARLSEILLPALRSTAQTSELAQEVAETPPVRLFDPEIGESNVATANRVLRNGHGYFRSIATSIEAGLSALRIEGLDEQTDFLEQRFPQADYGRNGPANGHSLRLTLQDKTVGDFLHRAPCLVRGYNFLGGAYFRAVGNPLQSKGMF